MTRIQAADLIRWLTESRTVAVGTDRAEVRALAFMLMMLYCAMVAEPGIFIGFIDETLQWKVASLCAFGRWPVSIAFLASAVMVMPHIFALAFLPGKLACQWPRQMAAFSCIVATAGWGLMAYLSGPLDFDWATTLFGIKCFVCMWLGIVIGLSLNAQQAREKASSLLRWQRMKEALLASQRTFNET